jgi:hypothetical protein
LLTKALAGSYVNAGRPPIAAISKGHGPEDIS